MDVVWTTAGVVHRKLRLGGCGACLWRGLVDAVAPGVVAGRHEG